MNLYFRPLRDITSKSHLKDSLISTCIKLNAKKENYPKLIKDLKNFAINSTKICNFSSYVSVYPSSRVEYEKILANESISNFNPEVHTNMNEFGNLLLSNRLFFDLRYYHGPVLPVMAIKNKISLKRRRFELYISSEYELERSLFFNGFWGAINIKRVMYPNRIYGSLKRSSNIVSVQNNEGMQLSHVEKIFENFYFNDITPPRTPNGYWNLYLSKPFQYLEILNTPFYYDNKILRICPYYSSALYLNKKNQIDPLVHHFYVPPSQKDTNIYSYCFDNFPNSVLTYQRYFNNSGRVYSLQSANCQEAEKVRFMSGAGIFKGIIFVSGEKITEKYIPSNTLILKIKSNMSVVREIAAKFPPNIHYQFIKKNNSIDITVYPDSMNQYIKFIQSPIFCGGNKYYFSPKRYGDYIEVDNALQCIKLDSSLKNEKSLEELFNPYKIKNIFWKSDGSVNILFSPEEFKKVLFHRIFFDGVLLKMDKLYLPRYSPLIKDIASLCNPFSILLKPKNADDLTTLKILSPMKYITECGSILEISNKATLNYYPIKKNITTFKIQLSDVSRALINRLNSLNIPVQFISKNHQNEFEFRVLLENLDELEKLYLTFYKLIPTNHKFQDSFEPKKFFIGLNVFNF